MKKVSAFTYISGTGSRPVVTDFLEIHRVDGILLLLLAPKSPRGLLGEMEIFFISFCDLLFPLAVVVEPRTRAT